MQPLEALADRDQAGTWFALVMVGLFAAIAVFLSAIGLYGVVATRLAIGLTAALMLTRTMTALLVGVGDRSVNVRSDDCSLSAHRERRVVGTGHPRGRP
jgi:hypothetical protein